MVRSGMVAACAVVTLIGMGASDAVGDALFLVRDKSGATYFTNTMPNKKSASIQRLPYGQTYRGYRYNPGSFSDIYDPIITAAAATYQLDPLLVKAVIKVESDFERYAISPKGARGLMQLMPGTAELMNVKNSFDPRDNIYGGARYLRKMFDTFNDTRLGIAAYNAGPTAVKRYGRIPPYSETERYVEKVLTCLTVLQNRKVGGRRIPVADQGSIAKVSYAAPPPAPVRPTVLYSYKDTNGQMVITDQQPEGVEFSVVD